MTEVGEHGENTPTVIGLGVNTQLDEDVANMGFDWLGAEVEDAADGLAASPYRHLSQNFTLSFCVTSQLPLFRLFARAQ